MKFVSIKQAKDHLTALARAVEAGERVVITRNGEPVIDLVPHRKRGGIDWDRLQRWKEAKGIGKIFGDVSEDFDDPLPEDFLLRPLP